MNLIAIIRILYNVIGQLSIPSKIPIHSDYRMNDGRRVGEDVDHGFAEKRGDKRYCFLSFVKGIFLFPTTRRCPYYNTQKKRLIPPSWGSQSPPPRGGG